MNEISARLIAEVERELADLAAADSAIAAGLAHRTERRQAGASVVYSIRLDAGEVAALERRAAVAGIKPTVLARNYIRMGLTRRNDRDLSEAVGRLEAEVATLRGLVG